MAGKTRRASLGPKTMPVGKATAKEEKITVQTVKLSEELNRRLGVYRANSGATNQETLVSALIAYLDAREA